MVEDGDEDDREHRPFFLVGDDCPIYFSEDWDAGIGGGLWSTGVAMGRYFAAHSESVRLQCRRLTEGGARRRRGGGGVQCGSASGTEPPPNGRSAALELGSGNGFLSVCLLASIGDGVFDELFVTDVSDHLPLIRRTLRSNRHIVEKFEILEGWDGRDRMGPGLAPGRGPVGAGGDETSVVGAGGTEGTRVIVAEHRWGVFDDGTDGGGNAAGADGTDHVLAADRRGGMKKFDFIFGSDLAYRDELHLPLIGSLAEFSHDGTVTLLGVTMSDTKPKFFHALDAAGFRYEKLADHLMDVEYRGDSFGLFAIQRKRRRMMEDRR